MKSKIDKSLIEVWEMKDRAYKAFLLSGYSSYADYVKDSTMDIIKKYNLKYYKSSEKKRIREIK